MERCPCCERAWNEQEDDRLFKHNQAHGEAYWPSLLKTAGLQRCEKSCQLRWIEFLKRCNISEDEEKLIIRLHALLGNRWSLIAGRLPGRTGKEIKNYWNTHIKRKLIGQGIDPESHRPINSADNESSSSNSHFFNHEIPAVDFFQNDGVGMSSDFEGSTSDAGKTNEGPSDVNLDLSIGLPLHNTERVDSKEVSD